MSTNVEILVPRRAEARLKKQLGALRATRFTSTPSGRDVARLLVTPLADLESVQGRRDLVALWTASPTPVVLLSTMSAAGKMMNAALLQGLFDVVRKIAHEPFVAAAESVRRVVHAHQLGAETKLIASAAIEDGVLVVWSCEPKRYEAPIAEILAPARMPKSQLSRFEVSSSGSRIHWLDADVDLDLDTIRAHADPEVRARHEQERRAEASRYASSIRALREERGLTQGQIEGLSARQVRRLEQGETMPQSETLKKLAAAHAMGVDEYLVELAARSKMGKRAPASTRAPRRTAKASS